MKVGIIGSRTFNDYPLLCSVLSNLDIEITEVISGGAKGADSLAKQYAQEQNIPIQEFLPDWKIYGRAAGPIRNKDIVKSSDLIIAFWDGKSRGTKSSIDFCDKLNTECKIISI